MFVFCYLPVTYRLIPSAIIKKKQLSTKKGMVDMKKICFLTLACILTMQTPVFAAYGGPSYTAILYEAQKDGFLDAETRPLTLVLGEQSCTVEFFQAARTIFVPLRETAAFLGKTVRYDKTFHTVTLLNEPTTSPPSTEVNASTKRFYLRSILIYNENHRIFFQNGHPLLADAYSLDGRLYVPLKLLTEASSLWFTREEDTIALQSSSGLVTPVRKFSSLDSDETAKYNQLMDSLTPLSIDNKADLKPYIEEIQRREKYAFSDYLKSMSIEYALVLYEDAPHILTRTYLLPLEECEGFSHYTLYHLNL